MLSLSPFFLENCDIENILHFWFKEFHDRWFGCQPSDDQQVSQLFICYDQKIRSRLLIIEAEDLLIEPSELARRILASILIYDQFYRHYARNQKLPTEEDPYNSCTCQWTEQLLSTIPKNHLDPYRLFDYLSPSEKCFALLPYRHSKEINKIQIAFSSIYHQTIYHQTTSDDIKSPSTCTRTGDLMSQHNDARDDKLPHIYQQFLKASISSWEKALYQYGIKINSSVVIDSAIGSDANSVTNSNIATAVFANGNGVSFRQSSKAISHRLSRGAISHRLSQNGGAKEKNTNHIYSVSSLDLQHLSPIMRRLVYWGVIKLPFPRVEETPFLETEETRIHVSDVFQVFRDIILQLQKSGQIKDRVAISLSGGVDSLLTIYFALALKQRGIFNEVVAIHINYGNRSNSNEEAEFVKEWCSHYQVKLYLREIHEIHRSHGSEHDLLHGSEHDLLHGSEHDSPRNYDFDQKISKLMTSRAFYERYTRHVRFDLYRQIGLPVLLGHNRDDCFENIFTNIIRSQHYDNLRAMTIYQNIQYDVAIIRPFLTTNKADIVKAVRGLNLVHTQNSTPPWSERYQLRNGIVDHLAKTSPNFLLGLESLSDKLANYSNRDAKLVQDVISKAKDHSVVEIPSMIINDLELLQSTVTQIVHIWGQASPSHKSIQHAYHILTAINNRDKNGKKTQPEIVLTRHLRLVPCLGTYQLKNLL